MITSQATLRYAQALFDLSTSPEEKQKRLGNLEHILQVFEQSPQFMRFFLSPQIQQKQKEKVLERILQNQKDEQLTFFLALLMKKERFHDLAKIVESYRKLVENTMGQMDVSLITPIPLEPSLKTIVQEKLEKKYQKKVVISEKIDPSLIGGGILVIGNQMLDFSVKNKLESLREDLLSIPV